MVQEIGWAPALVLTGAENLAPTGIRSTDRPASSDLLYRLSYPGHLLAKAHYIVEFDVSMNVTATRRPRSSEHKYGIN